VRAEGGTSRPHNRHQVCSGGGRLETGHG
jgi:hypothetical protein